MREDPLLFVESELSAVLTNQEKRMFAEIDAIPQKDILQLNVDELCDYYESEYAVEVPVIDNSRITVEQAESQIDVSQERGRDIRDRSRPFYVTGTSVTYFVPFVGDANLFRCSPSSKSSNPPRASIAQTELTLTYARRDQDSDRIAADFNRDSEGIQQHLGWIRRDVEDFNKQLRTRANTRIESRRAKALKDADLVSGLGYPLRRRDEAPATYVVPSIRRKPPFPKPAAVAPATPPDPALDDAEYEHILSVIENMVAVIERSPHAFHDMAEEDLRQHFLVQLNAQYEGQATGETFNYSGKTDILIRVEGRNIFIAECKFWKGPKSLIDTIDQLLSYTSWRDTKTAILLFNRTRSFSSVLKKIPEVMRSHPNFVREEPIEGESKFRYVFRHRDDPEREVVVSVLAFDVPA